YDVEGLPDGVTFDPVTHEISGQIANGSAAGGPYDVTVTVTNEMNLTATKTFRWTILARSPILTSPGLQTGAVQGSINIPISAFDPGGYGLTFGATGLPNGLSINSSTGVITGTIANGANVNSPYSVEVTVTNSQGLSDNKTFDWEVTPESPPQTTGGTNDGNTSDGGTNAGGTTDGGTNAGGTTDGGTNAGGTNDGGTNAGGTTDGGTNSGGTTDGGTTSGGTNDGGTNAGGTTDGGTTAGGTTDGGTNDGGTTAGGTNDGGTTAGGTNDGGTTGGGTTAGGTTTGGGTGGNQPPTIDTTFGPTSILEDSDPTTISLHVDDHETPAFNLSVSATASPSGIVNVWVSSPPGGAAGDRELQVMPIPDQYGDVTVNFTVTDAAGASTQKTTVIHVLPVNDAPSFSKGMDISVDAGIGRRLYLNWANSLSKGPANEGGQTLSFQLNGTTDEATSYAELFLEAPAISPDGNLYFKPAVNKFGTATVTVTVKDNGGTDNGGEDTSPPQVFTITVLDPNRFFLIDSANEMDTAPGLGVAIGTPGATGDIKVDWGDGTPAQVAYSGVFGQDGKMSFVVTHQFLDDDPTNTPHDDYTVNASVEQRLSTDAPGSGNAIYTFPANTIRINNLPPTQNVSLALGLFYPRNVNGRNAHLAVLNGEVADPSTEDSLTLHVDWGDNEVKDIPVDPLAVSTPGSDLFGGHLYVADPSKYAIIVENGKAYVNATVTTKDDDGGSSALQTFHLAIDTAPNDTRLNQQRQYFALSDSGLVVSDELGLLSGWADDDDDAGTGIKDILTAAMKTGPSHGTLTISPAGGFTYVPTGNYSGPDSFTYSVSDGWLQRTATVNLIVSPINLHSADFGGDGILSLKSDPKLEDGTSTSFSDREWLDSNDDGLVSDDRDVNAISGDHRYPVAYVSGSQITVTPVFKVALDNPELNDVLQTALVKVTGPGGITATVTGLRTPIIFSNVWPEHTTKYYDSFHLTWKISIDSGDHWIDISTSRNRLYVTYDTSVATIPIYESVIELSSRNALVSNTPNDIVSRIYDDFTDQVIKRVDGTLLRYWGAVSTADKIENLHDIFPQVDLSTVAKDAEDSISEVTQVKGLLRFGDGQCGAWEKLLMEMLRVQGLEPTGIMIVPAINPSNNSANNFLLVKKWTFSAGPGYWSQFNLGDEYNYNFETFRDNTNRNVLSEVTNDEGLAGQGNQEPPGKFLNHFLVRWDYQDDQGVNQHWYLDPSYGIAKQSTLLAWENEALDGIATYDTTIGNKLVGRAKPNDATVLEVREVDLP
ncbi:MAG: hypothetical protein JWN70_2546, partial [Planctomycetaceae bacterium]|nr:hypothetical protein [Planctomycetaceae bacterium]